MVILRQLVLVLVAVALSAAPGSAITTEQIQECARAAHDWLKAQQYTEEDVGKAIGYKDRSGQKATYEVKPEDVGAFPMSYKKDVTYYCLPNLHTYVVMDTLLTAVEAGYPVDKDMVLKALQYMWNVKGKYQRKEDPNGKWAYWVRIKGGKEIPSAGLTAKFALPFFRARQAGIVPDDKWNEYKPFLEKVINWLREGPNLQKEDKGYCWIDYPDRPGGAHGITDVTSYCFRTLLAAGVSPDDELILKVVEWFLNNQNEKGDFYTDPRDTGCPYPLYTTGHCRAMIALCDWLEAVQRAGKEDELKDMVEHVKDALKKAINYLLSLRDPETGMWGRGPLTEYPPDYGSTASALVALLRCAELGLIDPNHPAIVKALEVLHDQYLEAKRLRLPFYWYFIRSVWSPELRYRSQTLATSYALAAFALAEKLGVGKGVAKKRKRFPVAPEVLALALAASLLTRRR
ncbi:prenyltransferase/squalene oxidase repeat-containing protein [Methanopyrus kandleri]